MSFIFGRLKGFKYATKGFYLLATTEHSIMTQLGVSLIATIAGFYFNITQVEWMIQILAIGLVIGIEGLNTAIEKLSDFVHPEHHTQIGLIKDISAGAVFWAALCGVCIGLIIYVPYICNLCS